jgi:hypothetical protein
MSRSPALLDAAACDRLESRVHTQVKAVPVDRDDRRSDLPATVALDVRDPCVQQNADVRQIAQSKYR